MTRRGGTGRLDDGAASSARAAGLAGAMMKSACATRRRVTLARTVRQASPLLLDALARCPPSLGDVLDRLEPRPLTEATPADLRLRTSSRHHQRPAAPGCIRSRGNPSAPLALTPGPGLHLVWAGSRLGICGTAGRLRVSTVGAAAWLWIEEMLPETLALALVGRPVDALLAHPLLTGRDYAVLRVEHDMRSPGGTMIEIRTGLRRCRTPWTAQEASEAGAREMLALTEGVVGRVADGLDETGPAATTSASADSAGGTYVAAPDISG